MKISRRDLIKTGAAASTAFCANGTLSQPAEAAPLANVLFIPGVRVTLTAEAAGALNTVFNLNAFVQGFNIGTASVYAVGEGSRQRRFFGERSISEPDSSGNDQDENGRGIRRDQ